MIGSAHALARIERVPERDLHHRNLVRPHRSRRVLLPVRREGSPRAQNNSMGACKNRDQTAGMERADQHVDARSRIACLLAALLDAAGNEQVVGKQRGRVGGRERLVFGRWLRWCGRRRLADR